MHYTVMFSDKYLAFCVCVCVCAHACIYACVRAHSAHDYRCFINLSQTPGHSVGIERSHEAPGYASC